jgi:hypothetical protein
LNLIQKGDVISGWTWDGSEDWFTSRWSRAVQPMIDHQIPWAFACGNHDIEAEFNGRQIVDFDRLFNLSLTQHGPESIAGSTNYFLPIYSNESDSEITANLWIFDTGRHDCEGYTGWGCMQQNQISWYKEQSKLLNENKTIPSLAFFHIPVPEVRENNNR